MPNANRTLLYGRPVRAPVPHTLAARHDPTVLEPSHRRTRLRPTIAASDDVGPRLGVSTSRGALPRVGDAQHSPGTLAPIVLSLCTGAAQIVTFLGAVEAHPPSGVLADAAERAWHQPPKGAA
jgi:hypothetical protein